jgi:hypothetical protein
VDEAIVFGAALSLSSSAFVLEDCDSFALVHALCCGPVPTHVLKSFWRGKAWVAICLIPLMSAAFSGEGRATNTGWCCHFGYSASAGESLIHIFVTEEILL